MKMWKKVVACIMMLSMIFCVIPGIGDMTVKAAVFSSKKVVEKGDCGKKAKYVLYSDGTLKVTGTGVIKSQSFQFNDNRDFIKKVIISDGITGIEFQSFASCSNLCSVEVPKSVKSIDVHAFSGDESLTEIKVSNDNEVYISVDGVLYNKNKTELVLCPKGKKGKYKIIDGVKNIGSLAFSCCDKLTSVIIPEGVTDIGDTAFLYCSKLTSVTLPSSLVNIGDRAFESCTNLKTISIPKSVTWIGSQAFAECSSLTSVTLPPNLTYVESHLFLRCSSLCNVIIPSSVTEISYCVFAEADNLKDVYYTGTKKQWNKVQIDDKEDFSGITVHYNYVLGDTTVRKGTLFEKSGLNYKVTGNATVSFMGIADTKITKVNIPATVKHKNKTYKVTEIAPMALYGRTKITSVTIGKNIKTIGGSAFNKCKALAKIKIPNAVKTIESCAFSGCSALKTVTFGTGVKIIGTSAFANCKSLTKVTIPSKVTVIKHGTFEYCVKLKTVTFSAAVKTIEDNAFFGCSALTKVTIPNKVTEIGNNAFQSCTSLKPVRFGTAVKSIGHAAFFGCKSIKTIDIKSKKLEFVGIDAFWGIESSATIKVPASQLNEYKKLLKGKGQSSKVKIKKA